MKSRYVKKLLALAVSFSLTVGSVLPAYAAESGTDAEYPDPAGYGTEQSAEYESGEETADNGDDIIYTEEETEAGDPADISAAEISGADDGSGTDDAVPVEEGIESDDAIDGEAADEEADAAESPDTDVPGTEDDADEEEVPDGAEYTDEEESASPEEASDTEASPENAADEAIPEYDSPTSPNPASKEAAAEEETEGSCGVSLTWKLTSEGGTVTLTISGTGAMDAYSDASPAPWSAKMSQITDLVIENGATAIGAAAFAGASSLKRATIPSSVTGIPDAAFTGVSGLTVKGDFKTAAETFAKNHSFAFVPQSTTAISGATVTISPTSYTYDGKAKTPSVNVVYSVTPLASGKDYTVSYSNNTKAGTATVTVTGTGNFNGTAQKTFTISPRSLKGAKISGVAKSYPYVIGGVKPAPKVAAGGVTLKKGTDYTVSYKRYNKLGKATLTVKGKGNYSGSVKKTYKIVKASLKKAKVAKIKAKTYTGKAIRPLPVVKMKGKKLKKGRDYTLKYKNNVNVGKATITIRGKGKFKGTVKKTFKIQKASVAKARVFGIKTVSYTGSAITQSFTVKLGKKTLKAGRDYKVSYANNRNVGTATVKITGRGNYKGSKSLTFRIERASVTRASLSGLGEQGYTGKALKPAVTVRVAGRTLVKGTDYTVRYENNTNIGTARVIITGRGNYKDTIVGTFTIRRLSLENASVSVRDGTYTGMDVMPAVTVTLNGKTLRAGKEYSVRYSNNVNVGKASVTVTGIEPYAGSRSATFRIVPPNVKLTSAVDGGTYIKLTWTSIGNPDFFYEIQCASNSGFSSNMTRATVSGTASQYLISNRSLKTDHVRFRLGAKSDGIEYYSDWYVYN